MERILHVLPGLLVGGAERALERLLRSGLADRFENHVVALGGDGEMRAAFEHAGVPVQFMRGGNAMSALLFLRRCMKTIAPDIIQGWMYHGNLAASVTALQMRNRPTVFWNVRQSLSATRKDRLGTRAAIRLGAPLSRTARGIIYNSMLARTQHEAIGYAREGGTIIPNGFAPNPSTAHGSLAGLKAELALPEGAPVVIHVGRYHPVKDHATLIAACNIVAAQEPSAVFVLVGRGVTWDNPAISGSVPNEYKDRFRFLDERGDVSALLHLADLFVLSSIAEAFPNALGEAMATGIACVATDVGDVRAVLGDTGRVVPPGRSGAMADAILSYLQNDDLRRESASAAFQRATSEYGLAAPTGRYIALYENTLKSLRIDR